MLVDFWPYAAGNEQRETLLKAMHVIFNMLSMPGWAEEEYQLATVVTRVMMLSFESLFGLKECCISYFDLVFLPYSYTQWGFEYSETTPDTLGGDLLKPIARQETNNSREEELVATRYANNNTCESNISKWCVSTADTSRGSA
jgi:hypothetical protein